MAVAEKAKDLMQSAADVFAALRAFNPALRELTEIRR